ncbi:hypothetical protein RSOLAG1IB_10444 [Rhizoctonia solani AG-1 IB]|uniref:Uncharacterized protein n=1 Tax=Thanatephorus cucumeris (strain AG1-IB / isolate 7/3/14) TaxID=1108050 RepID=A0A0B7G1N0_THACB|nr:hypothetical protein RSOLAG1IB_10444 [Rhizoctonia solani AG-1 IB]
MDTPNLPRRKDGDLWMKETAFCTPPGIYWAGKINFLNVPRRIRRGLEGVENAIRFKAIVWCRVRYHSWQEIE